MIAVTFRRTGGEPIRLAIPRDDDEAVDFVLACAFRHFGEPNAVLPDPPKPRKPERRR